MEEWLNGWSRNGSIVVVGVGVHCCGCGKSQGVTCAVIEDYPEKDPDWPFQEADCPVCSAGFTATPEQVATLDISIVRKAIQLIKERSTDSQGK